MDNNEENVIPDQVINNNTLSFISPSNIVKTDFTDFFMNRKVMIVSDINGYTSIALKKKIKNFVNQKSTSQIKYILDPKTTNESFEVRAEIIAQNIGIVSEKLPGGKKRHRLETTDEIQNDINKKIAQKILNSAYSLIDKGCKKKVFHKNKAARKKSQLALALKSI